MDAHEMKVLAAIRYVEGVVEAARNGNDAGERAILVLAAAPDLLEAINDAPCPSSMGTASDHYSRFYDWLNGPAKLAVNKACGRRD